MAFMIVCSVLLVLPAVAPGQTEQQDGGDAGATIRDTADAESLATADLAEIDRKLNNPLTNLWSLSLQNNTNFNKGDAVDGTEVSNNLFFQPFLPFAVGENKETMLTFRPVFPLVTNPVFDPADPRESSDMTPD
jgi:hypothetical protein